MIYGYARVSTDGQSVELQTDQLLKAGASKIFSEKVSGAKTDRQELRKVIKVLRQDDVLIVTKLDRLARSLRDTLNVLDDISKSGAKFKSLNEPWADTTTDMGKFLTNILASVAELERSFIVQRTSEGRVRAMANGIKFGPKFKLNNHQREQAIKMRDEGKSNVEIARLFNVSHQTIGRL